MPLASSNARLARAGFAKTMTGSPCNAGLHRVRVGDASRLHQQLHGRRPIERVIPEMTARFFFCEAGRAFRPMFSVTPAESSLTPSLHRDSPLRTTSETAGERLRRPPAVGIQGGFMRARIVALG